MKNATKHPYPSQDSNPGPHDLKPNALALSHRATSKCYSISFSRSTSTSLYEYKINGMALNRVEEIRDLGVVVDRTLSFRNHIKKLSSAGCRNLGFVLRNSNDLSLNSVRLVYSSFVRSGLEYGSVVWSPFYHCDIDMLEKVQKKFFRHYAFRLGYVWSETDYETISNISNLQSLEKRRLNADLLFVYKLLNGDVNCPELLSEFQFNVGSRVNRNRPLFYIQSHARNYGYNSPLARLPREYNKCSLDIFNLSITTFRKALRCMAEHDYN